MEGKKRYGKHLQDFALFLLNGHLNEFVKESLQLIREFNIPALRYFAPLSDREVENIFRENNTRMLQSIANDSPHSFIEESLKQWVSNQLPFIKRDEVAIEDITLVGHIRKQTLINFVPRYTNEPQKIIALVRDIDDYMILFTSRYVKTYIDLLEQRINEHVAERNEIIHQLQQSDELFRQAQAITNIGNYVWHLNPDELKWSDELYRIHGLDPATTRITNELVASYNHPDDAETIQAHISHSRETLEPFNFHYRILQKNSTVRILHTRGQVIPDANGRPSMIVGTVQDVTEQKLTEQKLFENRMFIHKIADATPSIISSYNIKTGQYVFINQAFKTILGYDLHHVFEEGIGFFRKIIHPDDLPLIRERNAKALLDANTPPIDEFNEPTIEFQYRMLHKNGEYRWFNTIATVFDRDARQRVDHVLNIAMDITERVKAEQVLLQRTVELQQSNASLGEFAFIASHDLKEPLRKISTFADRLLINERHNFSPDGLAYLERIMSSSLRMQQMITDLLSLSQIKGDKSFVWYSLQSILEEVLQTFEYKIEETGAVVEATHLPEASIVPSQFRQLFQNLISNALKFSQQQVTPRITITYQYLAPADVAPYNLRPAQQYLQLDFSDNGIGFDNIFVDKMFSIFQRLHTRDKYEGTGIGLAICKRIVENHGGVILASGIPEKGATFTIIVPTKQ